MTRRAVSAALVLVLSPLSPGAQQPAQDPSVFRSAVHVVEVDVRVADGSGRFVADLTRDDFELLENGAPQSVESVYMVERGSVRRALPPATDAPAGSLPSTDPNSTLQTWIFAFDTNHLIAGAGFDRAKKFVEDFIDSRLPEGTLAGVLADGRMVNGRLTTVKAELVAAVKSVRPSSEATQLRRELIREWPRLQDEWEALQISLGNAEAIRTALSRACAEEPEACRLVDHEPTIREKGRKHHMALERSSQESIRFMNGLASGLSRMPGLKAIVLLSNGFWIERMEDAVRNAAGLAARAGARIYSVDVRGLNRNPGGGDIERAVAQDPFGSSLPLDLQSDGLNSLAVDTGGLMIRNENNVGRALDRIAADSSTYYMLAYRPSDQNFNGQFRKISVRVKRPGVVVRARSGYLATPAAPSLTTPAPAPPSVAAAPAAVPHMPASAALSPDTLPGGTAMAPPPERLDRVEKVAATETSAVRVAPHANEAKAKEGWARYAKGDLEGARTLLAEAAADDAPAWVFYALGQSEFALRRFDRAIAAFSTVRSRMPALREVYLDLADAHLQSGNVTDSLAVMRDAAARWPHDPEFQNAIGVLHVKRNALDEAINAFATAAQLAPSEPLAYFNLGRAYELRYTRGSRYVASMRQWIAPEGDRRKAAESYQRYLELGGPYAAQAREALLRLEWAK